MTCSMWIWGEDLKFQKEIPLASGHVGAGRFERLPCLLMRRPLPPRMPPRRAHCGLASRYASTATVVLSLIAKLAFASVGSEGEHEKADTIAVDRMTTATS